jgi:hypothetical protein
MDILINGTGFYYICADSPRGRRFMRHIDGCDDGLNAYCDDSRLVQAIADGAFAKGLTVAVNGRTYLGNGRVRA